MELLRPFKEINKKDAGLAGGKGASLGEMIQAGMPVPDGFVLLSTAFNRFIEEAAGGPDSSCLRADIDAILHSVDHQKIHTVEEAAERIQAMILSTEMPDDIGTQIQKYFQKMKCTLVAVRSSATAEDSSFAAWAGQLDTFLNTTKETLLENVKKC